MKSFLILLSSLLAVSAFAANIERENSNFKIGFIEGSKLSASVNSELGYIDNFLFTPDKESSTSYFSIKPSIFFQAHNEQHLGQVYSSATHTRYSQFSEDDHTDVTLLGKYFYKLASDHRVFLSGSVDRIFERRGTGLTAGAGDRFTVGQELERVLVNGGYQFGRVDSVTRFNAVIGQATNEYITNRALTSAKDRKNTFVSVDADYLLLTKTYLSALIELDDISYDVEHNLSRSRLSLLTGVKWQATDISKLSLLFGYEKLAFDNGVFTDKDRFVWKADYQWQPTALLNIRFSTARSTESSDELMQGYRELDTYNLRGIYRLTDSLLFNLALEYADSKQVTLTNIRDDSVIKAMTKLNYQYSERLSAAFSLAIHNKNSSAKTYGFDQQVAALTIKVEI